MIYKFDKSHGLTLSQNVWDRMHWAKRRAYGKLWEQYIFFRCGRRDPAPIRMRMTITRVSERLLDDSNLQAGAKPLIDAFKNLGHVYEDSPQWLQTVYKQRLCAEGEEPHMIFQIQPIPRQQP